MHNMENQTALSIASFSTNYYVSTWTKKQKHKLFLAFVSGPWDYCNDLPVYFFTSYLNSVSSHDHNFNIKDETTLHSFWKKTTISFWFPTDKLIYFKIAFWYSALVIIEPYMRAWQSFYTKLDPQSGCDRLYRKRRYVCRTLLMFKNTKCRHENKWRLI